MNFDQSYTTVAPTATFQSTGTMQTCGSAYSANPMINADGLATYTSQDASPEYAPGGPNRIVTPGNNGTQQPLGDGVFPLMLMALIFAGIMYLRRRQRPTE